MFFFLKSQGSSSPKMRFLGQKVCSVAHRQTDMKVKTEDTHQGFLNFSFKPIIKEQSNYTLITFLCHPIHLTSIPTNLPSACLELHACITECLPTLQPLCLHASAFYSFQANLVARLPSLCICQPACLPAYLQASLSTCQPTCRLVHTAPASKFH